LRTFQSVSLLSMMNSSLPVLLVLVGIRVSLAIAAGRRGRKRLGRSSPLAAA
jgi:hypothetical protein